MEEKRKLPKNVCQMGEADARLRVYLEDYVNLFLKKAAAGGISSVVIFLGETFAEGAERCVFIRGAMILEGAVRPGGTICLEDEVRGDIARNAEKDFPGETVVGWFVSGEAGEELDYSQCRRLKRQMIPGREAVLCVSGREERMLYDMTDEDSCPLKGYYIYYEKNRNMQEYMRGRTLPGKPGPAKPEKEEETVQAVRQALRRKRERKRVLSGRLAYGLCAGLAVLLVISGMLILGKRMTGFGNTETEAGREAEVGAEADRPRIREIEGDVYPTEPAAGTEETEETGGEE